MLDSPTPANCANLAVLPQIGDLFEFTYRVAPYNPETFVVIQVSPSIKLQSCMKIYEFRHKEWGQALKDFIPKKQEKADV